MLVITPSRSRPENIVKLIESFGETRTNAELLICVDDDDETLDGYKAIPRPPWAMLVIGPRLRLGPTLNLYATRLMEDHDEIGFMGDDHRPRTAGWDRRFREAIGRVGITYGNDLIQGPNIPTAVMMSSNIIKAIGYMVPRVLVHMYLDNFWKDLGMGLANHGIGKLTYLGDVVIEHMHPIAGKAEWDEQYKEVNGDLMNKDAASYEKFINAGMLKYDINAIQSYVNGIDA